MMSLIKLRILCKKYYTPKVLRPIYFIKIYIIISSSKTKCEYRHQNSTE